MSKNLFDIFEDYFYPQINIDGDGINADIERYETCYNLLLDLLSDLDEMAEQAGSSLRLPNRWEDDFNEWFNDCMTAYVADNNHESELSEENADKYMPYEYDYCRRCGIRCYYGAYPEAIINDDGNCLCELCLDEMNSEGKKAEETPKKVKIKIIRK